MQLFFAPTSPFARKVRIVAHELGVAERITMIAVDPWTDAGLRAVNPLAKVPTLVRDDGSALYDSGAICDFLDDMAGGGLIPRSGEPRWRALRLQALSADACTAAGRLFAGQRRGGVDPMAGRFTAAIDASLDVLEDEPLAPANPDLGDICAALLPAYLGFRWPDHRWRDGRPRLAAFLAAIECRPAFAATAHALPD